MFVGSYQVEDRVLEDIKHFLDIDCLDEIILKDIISQAVDLKASKSKTFPSTLGKTLALIFEKPSTRTRVSFEVGMLQLGGNVVILNDKETQLSRGETVSDTARLLSRYADIIMLRTDKHKRLNELASNASVPVINGLTDNTHPCQIMADILTFEETKKQSLAKKVFYSTGIFLRDNTIIFRLLNIFSDKTEIIKNYLKLKTKASKEYNKSFFNTKRDDVMYYRMTHIDRGYWTFNNDKFNEVSEGLKQSNKYLLKLFNLLQKNNINSTLIIYPWPTQILYGDDYHQNHWLNFSQKNNINFLSLYDKFQSNDIRKFIFENFIYGDIHWNSKGTNLIFKEVVKNIDF